MAGAGQQFAKPQRDRRPGVSFVRGPRQGGPTLRAGGRGGAEPQESLWQLNYTQPTKPPSGRCRESSDEKGGWSGGCLSRER